MILSLCYRHHQHRQNHPNLRGSPDDQGNVDEHVEDRIVFKKIKKWAQ